MEDDYKLIAKSLHGGEPSFVYLYRADSWISRKSAWPHRQGDAGFLPL